jgi:hypothetical protein
VHPVGKARRVIPAYEVHRLVAHAGANRVFRAADRAWGVGDTSTVIVAGFPFLMA